MIDTGSRPTSSTSPRWRAWKEPIGCPVWCLGSPDIRDEVLDFLTYFSDRTRLPQERFVAWIRIQPSKFADWKKHDVDFGHLNNCGTFYYLCSILDGCDRAIIH